MTTLHLLRTSGFSSSDLIECLDTLSKFDDLVLIDDGCYNVNHEAISQAKQTLNTPIKFIKLHADARGMTFNSSYMAIEMSDLVDLAFHHDNSVTWQ